MNCKKTADMFLEFVDNTLSKEGLKEFNSHIKSCKACQQELKEYIQIKELLKTLEKMPSPDLKDKILAKVAVKKPEIPWYKEKKLYASALALAACMAFVLSPLMKDFLSINPPPSTAVKPLIDRASVTPLPTESANLAVKEEAKTDEIVNDNNTESIIKETAKPKAPEKNAAVAADNKKPINKETPVSAPPPEILTGDQGSGSNNETANLFISGGGISGEDSGNNAFSGGAAGDTASGSTGTEPIVPKGSDENGADAAAASTMIEPDNNGIEKSPSETNAPPAKSGGGGGSTGGASPAIVSSSSAVSVLSGSGDDFKKYLSDNGITYSVLNINGYTVYSFSSSGYYKALNYGFVSAVSIGNKVYETITAQMKSGYYIVINP